MMGFKKPIRCFHFRSDGSEQSKCYRGDACSFTHPSDPGWDTASTSRIRRRDLSPPRRHRSPPQRSSRRESSYDGHRHRSAERRASSGRRPSVTTALPPPSTPPPPPSPVALTPIQPPVPPMPPSFPPPPSLPALPASSSAPPQPTPDVLRATWSERIQLMADCITGRQQYTKLDKDIEKTRSLQDLSRFSTLPEDSKQRIETELAELVAQRDEAKKKRDDALAQLAKTNSWPANPLTEAEEGEQARHQETLRYIEELKELVDEMNGLLNDLRNRKTEESTGDITPMDVDPQQGPSSRPLKRRRRLSDSVLDPDTIGGPSREELESALEKLSDLEARYTALENDTLVHDENTQAELIQNVESMLEDFGQSLSTPSWQETSSSVNDVKESIDAAGKDVETLVAEVATLVIQADTTRKEIDVIKQQLHLSKEEFARDREQFQSYVQAREKDHKRINALEAALQAYSTFPPVPSPPSLTYVQLAELMQEPLLDIVRATLQPLIEQLRAQVHEMLRTQNQEMYKALWGKLSLTLRMVESISQRLERAEHVGVKS